MAQTPIGVLHPGDMGASLAAALVKGGFRVYWLAEGRSDATRRRAEQAGLLESSSLAEMCAVCRLIVCICPPQFALKIAGEVVGQGFRGTYLDANAVSPRHAREIGELLRNCGARFVDGSIIGPPAWQPATTELYLCGEAAAEVAEYFSAGPLTVSVLGTEIGAASALKMCDSAFNKSLLALLYETLAGAEKLGVWEALQISWERNQGGAAAVSMANNRVGRSARKAWRFTGELEEVIDTLENLDISAEFHRHAHQVFEKLSDFRFSSEEPDTRAVIAALNGHDRDPAIALNKADDSGT